MGQCKTWTLDSGLDWTGLHCLLCTIYSPFYLKFIEPVCQGCRGSLKTSDGAIPSPPFDLSDPGIRSRFSNLITPKRPIVYQNHRRLGCIKAAEPHFVPSSLCIPQDIRTKLSSAHMQHERLRDTFVYIPMVSCCYFIC